MSKDTKPRTPKSDLWIRAPLEHRAAGLFVALTEVRTLAKLLDALEIYDNVEVAESVAALAKGIRNIADVALLENEV